MSRTARDARSKRFRLDSASSRCGGDVLATLAGDVQPVPHDSAWPLKNVSSVFWLFTEVNARFLRLERWVAAVKLVAAMSGVWTAD